MTNRYRVTARNSATRSENRIHDDTVARTHGFRGGLVPGVTLYGYMTRPVVEHYGREWLERGTIQVRFGRPVYEGSEVEITATEAASGSGGDIGLRLTDGDGAECVSGTASLPPAPVPPFEVEAVAQAEPPVSRPEADEASLAPGRTLGTWWESLDSERLAPSVAALGDDIPLCREQGLASPGAVILTANTVLSSNVLMGPWVHVGTELANLAAVPAGALLETRARVRDRFERQGHQLVQLEVVWRRDGEPVAAALHTAIYRLRS